jgi:hypothetical protein
MVKIVLYTLLFLAGIVLFVLLLVFISNSFFQSTRDYDFSGLIFVLISFYISLLIQFITGIILAANPKKKEVGVGLLISAGIVLLIGLSLCSGI